jgi:hypothetical protein
VLMAVLKSNANLILPHWEGFRNTSGKHE